MKIPSFKEFLILESISGERVAIFPGRYAPIHIGHLEAMKRTSDHFKCKVVILQIKSKNENSPFSDDILVKIGTAISKEYSFIADYFLYPPGEKTVIPQMVKFLQDKGFNPIGIGCGADREKDYQRQVIYLTSEKSDVKVDEFSVAMVDDRADNPYSGTAVRAAIKNDDIKEFERLTPNSVHKFYKELKKQLS